MSARLLLPLIGAAAFALAARLEPWYRGWAGYAERTGGFMQSLLGDSRQVFARSFFLRADAYFHGGFQPADDELAGDEGHDQDHDHDHDHEHQPTTAADGHDHAGHDEEECALAHGLRPPRDWIDAFGRNFRPSTHMHMEAGESGRHAETLPWLVLASRCDPKLVESYLVGAYVLRQELHRPDDAEALLREGLRHNPSHPELLLELGRLAYEDRRDATRARSLWNAVLAALRRDAQAGREVNPALFRGAHAYLARLEEDGGNYAEALRHLYTERDAFPDPGVALKENIARVEAKLAGRATSPAPRDP